MKSFIELSRALDGGMPVFPGHPKVEFSLMDAEPPRQIMRLQMGTHSGTHIDAARHFIPGGHTIDQYSLDRFVLPASVVRTEVQDDLEIEWVLLSAAVAALEPGNALLIETGWDRFWGDTRMFQHPYLGAEACQNLVDAGIGLVGTDALSVDSTIRRTREAHEILLRHDVLIIENLTNLSRLQPGLVYQCTFMPLHVTSGDGSPIRAYAEVDHTGIYAK